MDVQDLPPGQQLARTRWGTHTSGAAFDRKKTSYLTEQAQLFMAQQSLCVIAGLDMQDELSGLLALGRPGFVEPLGRNACLLQLDGHLGNTPVLQRLYHTPKRETRLGLFFICHPTRQRLCVQGTAELLPRISSSQPLLPQWWERLHHLISGRKSEVSSARFQQSMWVRVHVQQSFFHCAKYIKTRIPGLTYSVGESPAQKWWSAYLPSSSQAFLSEEIRTFLEKQMLCYLCTADRRGQCAVNHRGGAPGFLVSIPPNAASPGGTILLPDYAGNGAFEAIGNILETGQAALLVPNYAAQVALCISGLAAVLEVADLTPELAQRCAGAERVVALSVQRVEVQRGDWSVALAHERARAKSIVDVEEALTACPV